MKLWTLMENTACREDLQAEHGLSLYAELCGRKILFDTGQTGAFADNAEKLGVDLSQVELVILSHGHYDHGGGLQRFLQINDHAPIYLSRRAFGAYYNGTEKYIGLNPALKSSDRLRYVDDRLDLGGGLTLLSCNDLERPYGSEAYGLTVQEAGTVRPDPFLHEQYLLAEEQGRRILFSGCSHKGILNLESWFRPDVLIGGFHLKKLDPAGAGRQELERVARGLLEYPTRYYTCHCTGVSQYEYLKERMGDRLSYLSAGSYLVF